MMMIDPTTCNCPAWGEPTLEHSKDCPMNPSCADRAQQNARVADYLMQIPPEVDAAAREAWDHLVNVDDRTSPEDYPDMCLITFPELASFMLLANTLPDPPVEANHTEAPGAWDGPFTSGKCQVHDDTAGVYDGAAVFDVTGEPFALVADDNCVGGNPGARARATRIAEALNRDQQAFERGLASGCSVDEHGVLHIDVPRNSGLTGVSVSLPTT